MESQISVQKKRHHHTPVVYLKGFTGRDGCVYAYRKDEPERPLHVTPEAIAFERYYYSQPLPDGGRDNNTLEDLFSKVEGPWPQIVSDLENGRETDESFLRLCEFLMLQRVRGPCARDACEFFLAEFIKLKTRSLDAAGRLPPLPAGLDNLLDMLAVSIDPHMSIHAMAPMMKGFAKVIDRLGFELLHNETSLDLLTSDNPVVVFNPRLAEHSMQPYVLSRDLRDVELLFPVTARLLLRGTTDLQSGRPRHAPLRDEQFAKRVNRLIAKFGYRLVIATTTEHEPLIRKHAQRSPVSRFTAIETDAGPKLIRESVFGPRPEKAKWDS